MGSIAVSDERQWWMAWSQVPGVGPILLKRVFLHFGSLARAWSAPVEELRRVEGIGETSAAAIAAHCRQHNPLATEPSDREIAYVTPADAVYPALLFEIADPPPVLYYRGNLSLLGDCQRRAGVGIVGTRSPSEYGRRWTQRLSTALSRAGFPIISGLAEGVDCEAHRSCLDAGGHTIAVLGTGPDVVYPRRNLDLYRDIAAAGLLLSEYPPGTQPDRVHFPRRNRIIAGLSRAVLVTEAPERSGALITARLANDYGRDVYALPGSLDNPRCYGCLALVNTGAQLILGEHLLIEALGGIPLEAEPAAQQTELPLIPPQLDPPLDLVFANVPTEATPLDVIVQRSDRLTTGDILSALVQLELMGLVTQLPGMQYQRCS